jgi:hypothetical protein
VLTPAWCPAQSRRRPRLHRTLPSDAGRRGSIRTLGSRDQVRRLPHAGAPAKRTASRRARPGTTTSVAPAITRCSSSTISGDLERCLLRPGNVHTAESWRSVLEPSSPATANAGPFSTSVATRRSPSPTFTSCSRRRGSATPSACQPTPCCRSGSSADDRPAAPEQFGSARGLGFSGSSKVRSAARHIAD